MFGLIRIVLIGLPALLVALAPRRWLPIGMIVWFALPVLLYAAVMGVESVTHPAMEHPLQTAFYGFMIVSPLLVIPWLVVCLLGFGIGFVLRIFIGPARVPSAPAGGSPGTTRWSPPTATTPTAPAPPRQPGIAVPPPASAGPVESRVAPDGTIRIDLAAVEWSNTHWVMSPRVTDLTNGRIVLDLWGTDWDASADFPRPRCVQLGLRRYSHRGDWAITLDLGAETWQVLSEPGHRTPLPAESLAGIAMGLEAATTRADAFFAEVQAVAAQTAGGTRRGGLAAWRSALVILAGAVVAIGVLTYVVERFRTPPTVRIIPIPPMPSGAPSPGQR